MTVEGPVTSGIRRASASQTIPSAPWIIPREVKRTKSLKISSIRSSTTRGAQSTPRATTRCGSARSCANPSSQHLQLLQRKKKTKMMKMTRKTITVSNSSKTSSTSYLEETLAFQASSEAPTRRDPLSRTSNSEATQIQRGPHYLLQGGSMDQLL